MYIMNKVCIDFKKVCTKIYLFFNSTLSYSSWGFLVYPAERVIVPFLLKATVPKDLICVVCLQEENCVILFCEQLTLMYVNIRVPYSSSHSLFFSSKHYFSTLIHAGMRMLDLSLLIATWSHSKASVLSHSSSLLYSYPKGEAWLLLVGMYSRI